VTGTGEPRNWTTTARTYLEAELPIERLLPSDQPSYVRSRAYLFGMATVAGLVLLIVSGTILAIGGPNWTHTSSAGSFVNDVHWWGVQLFFLPLAVHFLAQFVQATWRGGRRVTWALGAVAFLVALPAAMTGFLSQQNFESQWIAMEAKDAVNAVGLAFLFNPLDTGRMLTFHVVVLPVLLVGSVGLHLIWVRRHGVCPPLPPDGDAGDHQGVASDEPGAVR
jgi:ubiquinol-cytochrome c reductase cytochrome b subunit